MKKKFRILLTLVMSLTMILGMSTTAYAGYTTGGYYYPDRVNACSEGYGDLALYYVSAIGNGTLTIYYNSDGSLNDASEDGHWKRRSIFPDSNPIIGRVYYQTGIGGPCCLDENDNPDPYLPPVFTETGWRNNCALFPYP